ncbi:hypothetical protein OIV83_006027 [Microbotryomycetes sp. JL201]|nr:hypothetical protein OIV83_006027 [Microbotryomycetes sp. JL201]
MTSHLQRPAPATDTCATATAPNLAQGSPSLVSILAAFQQNGQNDVELLKIILKAKEKEDERLAADAALKAEQLKVQHTLVLSQIYYAQQAQQHYAAPPYSPTSPPADHSPLSPYHTYPPRPSVGSDVSTPPESLKRSRAPSDASSSRSESSDSSAKKLKRSASATSGAGKPSREDVMAALRNKCQRNVHHAQHQQQALQKNVPAETATIAPRSGHTIKGEHAMPPPATRKSQSPPARHSAMLAQAARASPTSNVDDKSPSLKMLLNAVNSHTMAQTSDARSEHVVAASAPA